MERRSHVLVLVNPGLGHLIPLLELSKRLMAHHGFTVTVFMVPTQSNQIEPELLHSVSPSWSNIFRAVVLPQSLDSLAQLEPTAGILSRLLALKSGNLSILRAMIAEMSPRPTAMIIDVFWNDAISIAQEFNMRKYLFFVCNARFLAFTLYLPFADLNKVNRDEPFLIPGCEPVPGDDLVELAFRPNGRGYRELVDIGKDLPNVDGILVNTWEEVEAKTLSALRDDDGLLKPIVKVPVYPVGPLIRSVGERGSKQCEVIEWLDREPDRSVLYVSFGSGGALSEEQTIELAWGLELSQQRFVWVFRPPVDNDTSAYFFKTMDFGAPIEVSKYVPNGFLDRTRERGFMVPVWAPQEEIISHRSIGGFICHCGWNSIMESIVNGVPLIAWPLYAEQNMNAGAVTRDLGVAIRPKVKPSKGLVRREEVVELVRKVMVDKEGEDIRKRVNELKIGVKEVLNEGGSSYNALAKIAKDCEIETMKIAT